METERGKRKVRKGKVVSDKMQKTMIVEVERKFSHPVYKKVVRAKKKFKVHNPDNIAHMGDIVEIMETRPLSKEKRWRVIRVIEKAGGAVDEKTEKQENQKTEKPKNEKTI